MRRLVEDGYGDRRAACAARSSGWRATVWILDVCRGRLVASCRLMWGLPGAQQGSEDHVGPGASPAGKPGRRRDARADLKHAMYAGGHPNEAAKAIHRRFVSGPLPRLLPTGAVLDVRGRTTGAAIRVPLAVVRYRGGWYAVSMLGERANWVRNIRAAAGAAVLTHGRRRRVHLIEVPVSERAPIIRRYLMFAAGARPHISVNWRAPLTDFAAVAGEYPVFRITTARQ